MLLDEAWVSAWHAIQPLSKKGAMMRWKMGLVSLALLAGCAGEPASEGALARSDRLPPLADIFTCVATEDGLLIAAHRGGPGPGSPENALGTLKRTYDAGIRVFEVDVATSQDGVLFLMHDDTLARTTTSKARIADTDWTIISNVALKDPTGRVTRMTPPKLTDVLLWAKSSNSILELDRKRTTGWRDIISAVRAAEAENNVILITYSDEDAALAHSLAPDLMIAANVRGQRDLDRLTSVGVIADRLIGWTGTRMPNVPAWARLTRLGIAPAFGTLGRAGERLDDVYLADGDASEYKEMAGDGLVLIATDKAVELASLLTIDDVAIERCLMRPVPS